MRLGVPNSPPCLEMFTRVPLFWSPASFEPGRTWFRRQTSNPVFFYANSWIFAHTSWWCGCQPGNMDRYLDFDLAIGSGLYSTSQVAIPSRIVALRPGKFQVEMQCPQVMFLGIGCAHLLETWWILGLYMYHLVSWADVDIYVDIILW